MRNLSCFFVTNIFRDTHEVLFRRILIEMHMYCVLLERA
jgi:hypothetical protein